MSYPEYPSPSSQQPTSSPYAKGDTVYLPDGTKCEYSTPLHHDQHLVYVLSRLNEDAAADIYSRPLVTSEILPSPPIPERHKELAELDERIYQKQTKLFRLEDRIRKLEAAAAEQQLLLQTHEVYGQIRDFLDKRLQYLVLDPTYGAVTVETLSDALQSNNRLSKGVKLLSLFGDLRGELKWQVNSYSDGSGSYFDVYPAKTKAIARDICEKLFASRFKHAILEFRLERLEALQTNVLELNRQHDFDLQVPPEVSAALVASRRQELERKRKELLAKLSDCEQSLSLVSGTSGESE